MTNRIFGHVVGFFAVIGMLVACAPQSASSPMPTLTAPASPKPVLPTETPDESTNKVDIGGRSLYYNCLGEGTPTVILETGWAGPGSQWLRVMNEARLFSRLCSYDRAALGQSDPAPAPRTSADMATDLHALLTGAEIPGPYILVGHSFGGFIVRLYANEYPEEVAGIVLVDSTHPDQDQAYLDGLPEESSGESDCVQAFRTDLTTYYDPVEQIEGLDWYASTDQVRELGSLGDLPLAVVTAGWSVCGGPKPPEDAAGLDEAWQRLQEELVGLSSNSVQIIADRSSHDIPTYQPEAVIEGLQAVMEMINAP